MGTSAIILAAGKGTRMRSSLPKVLHKVAHMPLLEHVFYAAKTVPDCSVSIIFGHGGDVVKETLSDLKADWIEQREQLGTGHAVQQVVPVISDDDTVLILYGDVPLTLPSTLLDLVDSSQTTGFCLLTVELEDPTGYGRIVRDKTGSVEKIVEEKDADDKIKKISEVNTGMMAVSGVLLKKWLGQLDNNNAQGEYYLTDIVEMAVQDGIEIMSIQPENEYEVLGVNNRLQLAELERFYQLKNAEELMTAGVTLRDPSRIDVRGDLEVGQDILIDINVIFEGKVSLSNNVKIGPNTTIKNAVIGENVEILANSVIEDAVIGKGTKIGPFARIRPGTNLGENVHVGNFVEIKKSEVAEGSKINHLSYIGDSEIGTKVNIGAGTITCNYDGANKFRTVIGNNVFIGSDTQLVAPVEIADGATIAAGTTLTKDAPADQLTLSRAKQVTVSSWKRPIKK
ncbi:MAG: bifunctional UDP-N-acetylglucosamine diphosphorylase/glucosamine-1-phosphate N-acetyltransferase GlmU [Gammaproteobacteria bacterium]